MAVAPQGGDLPRPSFMRTVSQPSRADHILAGDFDDAGGEAGGADADKEDAAALE